MRRSMYLGECSETHRGTVEGDVTHEVYMERRRVVTPTKAQAKKIHAIGKKVQSILEALKEIKESSMGSRKMEEALKKLEEAQSKIEE